MTRQAPDMAAMHGLEVFRHYDKNHWRLHSLPLRALDRGLVKPEYIALVRSAAMAESNMIATVRGVLDEFADDCDFSAFAMIWGYQEVQHHCAFSPWLQAACEQVDSRAGVATHASSVPGTTPSATLATNIISELTVNHVYRAVAAWVEEPVLKELFLRAGRDEAVHARGFRHFTARRLAAHPDELPSVLETLCVHTSDEEIKHPVGVLKAGLGLLPGTTTIDTGFERFLDTIAGKSGPAEWRAKIRRTFASLTGHDLSSSHAVEHALATALG